MNEKYLRYFVVVYNYRNISKAAAEIHISRQALSKIIHDLEEATGCRLFRRSSAGLQPTDAGHELYVHAERIIHEFDRILQMNYLENIRSREVTVYTLMPLRTAWVRNFSLLFTRSIRTSSSICRR